MAPCAQEKAAKRPAPTANNAKTIDKSARRPIKLATVKGMDALSIINQASSPFLRLPRELRDTIYGYAIGGNEFRPLEGYEDKNILVVSKPYYNFTLLDTYLWQELFSLSRVCRQLHAETHILPYTLNVFQFGTCPFMGTHNKFLSLLKEEHKRSVTMLSFGFKDSRPWWVPFLNCRNIDNELSGLINLKSVIVRDTMVSKDLETVGKLAEKRGLIIIEESAGDDVDQPTDRTYLDYERAIF